MARHLSSQNLRPFPGPCFSSQHLHTLTHKPTGISFTPFKLGRKANTNKAIKWNVKMSAVNQVPQKPAVEVNQLVEFLYEDLPHLFDDQGIDRTMYDEQVKFRDPITKHDTISGYLFNIDLLKKLFQPEFQLHSVKQTGPYEITTRWTMVMKFMLLPWKPELVFTGLSIMGINPATKKFCSHLDIWDSIRNNDYFSLEGLWDVMRQLRIYKTPDLESPKYQILKRTANYEVLHLLFIPIPKYKTQVTVILSYLTLLAQVNRSLVFINVRIQVRKYSPFVVVETNVDKLSGSTGFNDVAGYIFGKNSAAEKIPMTTPVFTQAFDDEKSEIAIQIVLPVEKDLNSLPDPNKETLSLRKFEGGIAAVSKFSGQPTEDVVREKEKELRIVLVKEGLKAKKGCMFARYNDPGRTWSFIMRNEVLIWLEDFMLE